MAKQTFAFGSQLSSQKMTDLQTNDFNWTVTTQTANYTLQAADKGTREVMNMSTAGTVTIPAATFDAGDIVWVHSIGSGTITLAAGTGMTLNSAIGTAPTLTQWEGGVVYFTSASASIFFRGGRTNTLSVDYLLVGGGGGGGYSRGTPYCGGGGGAGGFLTATDLIARGNTYTVTVGAGGAGGDNAGSSANIHGRSGGASSFIRSVAGGGGGTGSLTDINPSATGINGGSGGGANHGAGIAGGAGVSGQGSAGGQSTTQAGGGGGGAGGVGGNASTTTGGAGGAASSNSYTGSAISYSGGGGGGGSTGGTGGTNAGNGGSGTSGGNATANRGGGGGGSALNGGVGGNGGSGRVVLQIVTANLAPFSVTTTGSPTVGTNGIYTYYAYDANGTFRID